MRFRMLFETEDSSVRRYMGTITGISDLDPVRWKNSHWRNLQVASHMIYSKHIMVPKPALFHSDRSFCVFWIILRLGGMSQQQQRGEPVCHYGRLSLLQHHFIYALRRSLDPNSPSNQGHQVNAPNHPPTHPQTHTHTQRRKKKDNVKVQREKK